MPMKPTMTTRRHRAAITDESGTMLIELLIALTFLVIAVGGLLSVFASSVISLRHASIEGNALTLADKQMETYKTIAYASIGIKTSTIPGSGDLYISSPPTSLTSSQQASITTGQVNAGTIPATQTVTGPDNRTYRIDSYVFPTTAGNGYEAYVQVTIAVRSVSGGVVGPIRAQATSAFDQASTRPPPS
jgi:Tfp pilus assembly protein PilV